MLNKKRTGNLKRNLKGNAKGNVNMEFKRKVKKELFLFFPHTHAIEILTTTMKS
jgi:hypothetical protein